MSECQLKQMHVLFQGRVQGVGFRYTVQHIARAYPVTGYVRNLMNGDVEMAAEGEEHELERFFIAICSSPLKHNIHHCEKTFREPLGTYKRFSIAL